MSTYGIETRGNPQPLECRSLDGGKHLVIAGYAAVFGSRSQLMPQGFRELVSEAFFNKSKGDGWPGFPPRPWAGWRRSALRRGPRRHR